MSNPRTATTLLIIAALAALTATGLMGIADTLQTIRDTQRSRASYASLGLRQRVDYPQSTIDPEGAFRRFKEMLRSGEHFSVVVSSSEFADRAAFYRVFALYYLYPAIAIADPLQADALLVFGPMPARLRARLENRAVRVGSAWMGRIN